MKKEKNARFVVCENAKEGKAKGKQRYNVRNVLVIFFSKQGASKNQFVGQKG